MGYFFAMSKAEILADLPKLTPTERQEIRRQLTKRKGARGIMGGVIADKASAQRWSWGVARSISSGVGLSSGSLISIRP